MKFYRNKLIMPIIAGILWTKNIFFETEIPPYIPAITTHIKKNKAIFLLQIGSEINKDQIKPEAKNPLYKPWFAAIVFVFSNKSSGKDLKTFLPFVVQTNISNQRK